MRSNTGALDKAARERDGCIGMDIPIGEWTKEDVAFWTGTPRYQPWKDVAVFFKENREP